MKAFARLVLIFALALPTFAQSSGIIFIVRHAEKQSDADDSLLSAEGQRRAECLGQTLRDAHVVAFIHSQYIRTKQTGAPLMAQSHATESTMPAKSFEQVASTARNAAQTGNVLIVGHSNTIPDIIKALGGPSVVIPDTAYDFLFLVDSRNSKNPITLHYCTELNVGPAGKTGSMAK